MNFLFLYFLNLLGDYPLQGEFLAKMKCSSYYLMYVHCAIWTGTVCVGLYLTGALAIWKIIFLLVGHLLIDQYKCGKRTQDYIKGNKDKSLTSDLWVDQTLHVFQILIITIF